MFGEVEHWWYRVKSQNRGALHIHMILWVKEGTMPDDVIVAQLPRGNDDLEQMKMKKLHFQNIFLNTIIQCQKMCQNMVSIINMKHLTTWLCTKEPNL